MSEEAGEGLTMMMEEKHDPLNLVIANATESNMNDLSFLHQIGIPIILMASVTDMKTAAKAVADWGCHFLEKPISIEDIDLVWQVAYKRIRNPRANNLHENGSISGIVNGAREVGWKSIEENAIEAQKCQIDGSISGIVNVARGVEWKSIEENAIEGQKYQNDESISRIVNVARGVEWKSMEENANQWHNSQNDGSLSNIVNVARGVEWKSMEENANQGHKSQNDGSISRIVNIARGVEWKSIEENVNHAQKSQNDKSISKIVNVARGVEWKSIEENAYQAQKSQNDGSISRIVNVARGVEWKSIEENENHAQKSQNDGSLSKIVNVARGVEWKSIKGNANQAQKSQNDGSLSRIVNVARGVEWKSIEENANLAQKSQNDGSISRIVNVARGVEWKSIEENANQVHKSQNDGSISRMTNVARGVEWKPMEEEGNGGDRAATAFDYLETAKTNREEGTNKRSRIVWSSKLHRKFTEALSKLGNRKSSPKIILKMMNEPTLTLRQVASHLQKFKSQVKHLNKITASDSSTSLSRNQLQQLPAKLNPNILGQPNYISNITDNQRQLQAPTCLNGPSPRLPPSQAVNCYLRVMNQNSSNSYKTTQHSDPHPETYGGFEGANLVEDNCVFTDELYMNESLDGFAPTPQFNLQYFGADEDCPLLSADNHHLDAVQEMEFAQNLAGCLDFDKITPGAHSVTAGLLNQNVALKELDNLLNNTEEDPMVCCRFSDEMNSFDIDQYSEWLNA